jgi:methionyl-tRNA formyltransferase
METLLLLGTSAQRLAGFLGLRHPAARIIHSESPAADWPAEYASADWVISWGYRQILKAELLGRFKRPPINLHISLLPWNRGADPNLWSFLEDSPKGVTIHQLDAGIDTGPILTQSEVKFQGEETLKSSYDILQAKIEALFLEKWPEIYSGRLKGVPQAPGGSYHRISDRKRVEHLLTRGWDTPVKELTGQLAKENAR